jgi:hypothetical protein
VSILHLRTDTAQNCGKYSIVGNYASRPFVKHVAMLPDATSLLFGADNVLVCHIGPPLVAGARTSAAAADKCRKTTVHIVGYVDLDADDLEGIKTWLSEVDKEDRPLGMSPTDLFAQYRADPPIYWVLSEKGTPLYRRFSCAGFVMDGYRYIGINLIDDSRPENLPEVTLAEVVNAYGAVATKESRRDKIGIPGAGPWRIVLAGYIFHSLQRDEAVIRQTPYIPSGIADKDFNTPDLPPPATAPDQKKP